MRVELKSISNARELGGYMTSDGRMVKSGVLLRTGRLDYISDEDKSVLQNRYHVEDVIGFRMDMEIVKQQFPDGAKYHHVQIIDTGRLDEKAAKRGLFEMSPDEFLEFIKTAENLGIFGEKMYINFLENAVGQRGYREFFRILLESEKAVLWHCTSGKDRTGLAAMLILSALGVKEDVIIQDYLLTNAYNAERIQKTRAYFLDKTNDSVTAEKAVLLIDGVSEKTMKNVLEHLKSKYDSVIGYMTDVLGITISEINFLREKFLI